MKSGVRFLTVDVVDDEEKGVVVAGGREIEGFIDSRVCPRCCEHRIYFDDYDAFFCASCNVWLESACSDATCEYCKDRPEKPLAED